MEITTEILNEVAVIAIKGKLNVTTVADLESAFNTLFEDSKKNVVVDCCELDYISSAGLRALLAAAKQFKKVGGVIVLASLSNNVQQVFEISGFTSIFPIYSSKDEAVSSF